MQDAQHFPCLAQKPQFYLFDSQEWNSHRFFEWINDVHTGRISSINFREINTRRSKLHNISLVCPEATILPVRVAGVECPQMFWPDQRHEHERVSTINFRQINRRRSKLHNISGVWPCLTTILHLQGAGVECPSMFWPHQRRENREGSQHKLQGNQPLPKQVAQYFLCLALLAHNFTSSSHRSGMPTNVLVESRA